MRYYLGVLVAVLLLAVPWFAFNYPQETQSFISLFKDAGDELAAVLVTHNPKTVSGLQTAYNSASTPGTVQIPAKKVRILLVPGHEPGFGGAEYGTLKEREMTVTLAQDLRQFLSADPRYQVFVTRDTSSWSPTFSDYFKNHWQDIIDWQKAYKSEVINLTRLGEFQPVAPTVVHNNAPTDVATRLFGIDKWSNENDIDIMIHIHFNDYPGHGGMPGKYSGFTIYVPEKHFANSPTTKALAQAVSKRLEKYNPISNLPGEQSGIVEDQDLIAVGSYNSVNAASMLIEYAYIYEPQLVNPATRDLAIKDMAFQTFLGLQDFLNPTNAVNIAGAYDTLLVPHSWQSAATAKKMAASDILALQTALLLDGDYPPTDRTKTDCPRTGTFGNCTKSALDAFQKKYGITGESGVVGAQTMQKLNTLYSTKVI